MTTRRKISTRERVKIFERNGGRCHLCSTTVQPGQEWHVSHEIPLECGGADDDQNRKVAHATCHRSHTAKVDAPLIAKVKRQHAKHIGADAPKAKIKSAGFPKKERPEKLPIPRASRDIFGRGIK